MWTARAAVTERQAPADRGVEVRPQPLVHGTAFGSICPSERHEGATHDIDVARRRVLEATTVACHAPPPARDRDGPVLEGADAGA